MFKSCNKTYRKKHAEYSQKLKRYKGLCLHKGKCILQDIAIAPNVINILDRPITEGYKFIKKLTDAELDFYIKNEKRKSGLAKLERYKKNTGKKPERSESNENIS